jgi:hypothetical protein
MTKRKTALQSAIEEIQDTPNYSTGIEYRLRNKIIEILESKLPQEKQDLIEAFDEGTIATSYNTFDEEYEICPSKEEYFNQTFEI